MFASEVWLKLILNNIQRTQEVGNALDGFIHFADPLGSGLCARYSGRINSLAARRCSDSSDMESAQRAQEYGVNTHRVT